MKITNTQKGPRGVNSVDGPVLIEPGETVDVVLSEAELAVSRRTGWFDISGRAAASKPAGGETEVSAAELADKADDMHFQTFKSEARKILGEDTPDTKDEIIAALRAKS